MRRPCFKRKIVHAAVLVVLATGLYSSVQAQQEPQKAETASNAVANSSLNGPLFQQLLTAEIEVREGHWVTAYQLMLDAAKRTKETQLFRRATEMALQARSGDDALAAVRAWRQADSQASDALRYETQLLVQMDRVSEIEEPLQTLLKMSTPAQRPALMNELPRLVRGKNRTAQTQAAALIEQVLAPYAQTEEAAGAAASELPSTRMLATLSIGRAWLAAENSKKALFFTNSAHEMNRTAEPPAALALDLIPSTPEAEALVQSHLNAKPSSNGIRLAYVRVLLNAQRLVDATAEVTLLTRNAPTFAQAWLTLGALHLQQREPEAATVALNKYIEVTQTADKSTAADPLSLGADDDNAAPPSKEETLARGWLLLSQAADQQGDFKAAQRWLDKVDVPQRSFEVQVRRASLMARDGKLPQARELLRKIPEKTPDDARAKVFAEAQLLRDAKQWIEASAVLAKAETQFPDNVDLIYEQAMMLEKLNRLDDMERLLRRVITLKPDHQHAYNALGYSLAERNLRLPEARDLIKKALELSPGEASITDSLGWVEYKLGNREEAIRLLRQAYRGQPDAEVAAHLGEVLWVDGQTDEARRVWREARTRDAKNEVLRETLVRLRVDL
jgi:tetratricopeptide (TPR) repeat protein